MTLLEYVDAFDKDPHAMAVEFFHCIKRGDFTAEEFNSLQQSRALAPLYLIIDEFYEGGLFKAQNCDFVAWCDGHDAYHDRSAAEKYRKFSAEARHQDAELERYIAAMVAPKRLPTKILNENPSERQKILDAWNKKIDTNGWRSWPKQRGTK